MKRVSRRAGLARKDWHLDDLRARFSLNSEALGRLLLATRRPEQAGPGRWGCQRASGSVGQLSWLKWKVEGALEQRVEPQRAQARCAQIGHGNKTMTPASHNSTATSRALASNNNNNNRYAHSALQEHLGLRHLRTFPSSSYQSLPRPRLHP